MKQFNKILVLFVLLSTLSVDNTYSQSFTERIGAESNGYNPLSLRKVHESYLMWKKTLWRRVDLKEKQNKPFFARNREISKIIIEAVERGVLIPYNSDSVNDSNVMSREEFVENIQQVDEEIEEEELEPEATEDGIEAEEEESDSEPIPEQEEIEPLANDSAVEDQREEELVDETEEEEASPLEDDEAETMAEEEEPAPLAEEPEEEVDPVPPEPVEAEETSEAEGQTGELELDLPDPEETLRKVDALLAGEDASNEPGPDTKEQPKSSKTGSTSVVANVMIGIGNKPYLRGEGAGLSWDEGVPMNFIEIGKWAWTPTRKNAALTVQVYRNDEDPDNGGKIEVKSGEEIEITPDFG